jgi:pimeloyl-ACP methyl ester carboxylesterase
MLTDVARFETHDGLTLSYEAGGEGAPVLLLHGFASDSYINWIRPGFTDALEGAGVRWIALDQRGHGASSKPHDPAAYADGAMVRDVVALLDHLGLDACRLVGYSMGAWIAFRVTVDDRRVRAAVLGGVGAAMLGPRRPGDVMAEALEADDKTTVTDPFARSFRDFADITGADRLALAAFQRATAADPRPQDFDAVRVPVLVITGDNDPLAGSPAEVAERFARARSEVVGGTHLNVVNNAAFHQAVIGFLKEG